MRKVALGIAVATIVAGCQGDGAGVATQGGNVASTTAPAIAKLAGTRTTVSSVAGHADRGLLFSYADGAPVHVGAVTRREIQVSEAHALRAVAEKGAMTIQAPDGTPIRLEYARIVEHDDGNWSYVGHQANAQPGEQAVITFGEKAVFGLIPTRNGEALEIGTMGGRTFIAQSDPGKRPAPNDALMQDTISAVMAEGASTESTNLASAAAAGITARMGKGASVARANAIPAQSNTVDLLLGYTPTFRDRFGGTSEAVTRLTAMVDVANSALEASQVDGRFNLVGTLEVNVADNTSNRTTLFQLTGVTCTNGGSQALPDDGLTCTPADRPAALQALAQQRNALGADIVGLVRTYQSPENQSCGLGWLSGAGQTPIDGADANFAYVVVSDTMGNAFPDPGDRSTCRTDNLAHELGHVLGIQHDRAIAANSDNDAVLDPEEFGRYPYAFGYVAPPTAGNFYDTMAPRRDGVTQRVLYSNPQVTFNGFPAGVPDQDDAARALRQTIPMVSGFRGAPARRLNDFDGDGRSDILWHHTTTGQSQIWRAANNTTQIPVTTVSIAWKIVGTGDFNGDGRADILWRNSSTGGNTIYLSGNSATQQKVTTVAAQQWTVVGVGDFNADGRSDILWRHSTSGQNTIWLSANNATQQAVASVANLQWRVMGVGDFNGDGRADILWRNFTTGANLIWRSGSSATQQPIGSVGGTQWTIVGVDDFDGDGVSDILWRNTGSGANTIWRSGNNATQMAVATVASQNWRVVRTGDYDGDGLGDILWRNSSTGENLLWRSGSASTQLPLAGVGNQAWIVNG